MDTKAQACADLGSTDAWWGAVGAVYAVMAGFLSGIRCFFGVRAHCMLEQTQAPMAV